MKRCTRTTTLVSLNDGIYSLIMFMIFYFV
jgi:hypothetical protein